MPTQYIATGTNRAMIEREADFAYKQAFAFCPYSPEAVYRYVQLLVNLHRVKDALAVAETAQRLDPYNHVVRYLIDNLKQIRAQDDAAGANAGGNCAIGKRNHSPGRPTFVQQFDLAQKLMQIGQNDRAFQVLDGVLANPQGDDSYGDVGGGRLQSIWPAGRSCRTRWKR